MTRTFAAQLLLLACMPVLAWFLVVYRVKILMKLVGLAMLGLLALSYLGLDWPLRWSLRLAQWIGREIEENG